MLIRALQKHFAKELANDQLHQEALDKTGFWGAQGAGAIVLALSSRSILLAHRSAHVEQPHTWGSWGGAIDPKEDPKVAAVRELREETGFKGEVVKTFPLYVFRKDSFRYSNFLIVIEDDFIPKLNWESQDFGWFKFGEWPKPLHFGLAALFADGKSIATIKRVIAEGVK